MQTVQFQCGHCGKLMAVNNQHLGQQVRCPHCQQVVIAPPPANPWTVGASVLSPPASPPGLTETVLHTPAFSNAAEDIFAPADVSSELFRYSEAPQVEAPSESLAPTLPGDNVPPPPGPLSTLASPLPGMNLPAVAAPPASSAPLAQSENTDVLPGSGAPLWSGGPLTETSPPPPGTAPPDDVRSESAVARVRERRPSQTKTPWFLLLVFCPLVLYAVVISIFALLLYREHQQLQEKFRERFDTMPDVGDDPGVRKGKKVSRTDKYKPELATLPLPESLCTTLGKPLRVGDLQVTPNRVERQRVFVVVGPSRPEPCQNDSLVLYLDLKNLATDYAFAPLDNYFDRYWRPGLDLIPPLTLLEVGNKYRCYGGPAHWYPRGDPANRREWVKGRRDQGDFLEPGEEKQMFVCTDGDDAEAAAVLFGTEAGEAYHGPFLWRVRVRRGLVRVEDKDYPATAVIGIRFTDADIRQAAPAAQ
jgi:DNA-directed RNA polymerase subunit RPC12/RpoP